jgi:pyrimidine dimer DNA glycosylase
LRLWSIHPALLDGVGLVALWRESLLAQHVLLGLTKGYRFHPQLERFQQTRNPIAAISTYLWGVHEEANQRGYAFDASKIVGTPGKTRITVSRGQLLYEWEHLKNKLRERDPVHFQALPKIPRNIRTHPMFTVVPGPLESWERT